MVNYLKDNPYFFIEVEKKNDYNIKSESLNKESFGKKIN